MLKAALKSLLAHKTRLILTAISIILGVAFVAGTFVYTDTTDRAFSTIMDDAFSGLDIVVSGDSDFTFGGTGIYFDESMLDDIAAVDGVESVVPGIDGFGTQILDPDGEPIGGGGPPQLSGFLPEEVGTAGGFVLRQGRAPASDGEVVIDAASADTGGYQVGDTVAIVSQALPVADYQLVGVVGFGQADNLGGATFALFDLLTAQAVLGQEGKVTGAFIQAAPDADIAALTQRIDQVLPDNAKAQTAQSASEEQAAIFQEALSFFSIFLLVFGFIALFVGTFIIYNTFQIVIAQRVRELALMRAIGSTRGQVVRAVLIEALIVGVIASAIGIAVGAGLSVLLRLGLEAAGITLPGGGLVIQARTVIVALGVGVVVTVLSALAPALQASRIAPVAAMRQDAGRPRERSLLWRTIIGALLLAAGIASLATGLFADLGNTVAALSSIGLGAVLILVAAYVLSALIAEPVTRIIGAPLARIQGVPGRLAQRNAGRSPRRTTATAAAIMIGIALITLVTVLTASVRDTIDDVFTGGVNGEVIALGSDQFALTGFPAAFGEAAAALPEVEAASRLQFGPVIRDGSETFVNAIDDNFPELFDVDDLEGSLTPSDTGIIVPRAMADSNDWQLGTTIDLTFEQTGTVTFTVEGIADSTFIDSPTIGRAAYNANFAIPADGQIYFRIADGFTVEEGVAAISAVAEEFPTVNVQTLGEFSAELQDSIGQVLSLLTALLGLTILISLFGVMNTLLLSVHERTREIGLLRAVGLDRTQTRRMIRSEASIIATLGSLLGVGLGIFFGWAVVQGLEAEGFTGFSVPIPTLLLWIVVTALLAVVFALLPAWRASRLDVLDAISYE
ncbi:MAG: FtsX-like permease family protein [Acidimicrobiia bacterium]|nr:FtsX-like permease family protein [Acidimicrobiia bacterium]